jgi:hypothetical protein
MDGAVSDAPSCTLTGLHAKNATMCFTCSLQAAINSSLAINTHRLLEAFALQLLLRDDQHLMKREGVALLMNARISAPLQRAVNSTTNSN